MFGVFLCMLPLALCSFSFFFGRGALTPVGIKYLLCVRSLVEVGTAAVAKVNDREQKVTHVSACGLQEAAYGESVTLINGTRAAAGVGVTGFLRGVVNIDN